MENNLFYTRQQLKVFAEDLLKTFVNSGFDILEAPYIDYDLCGFRATYIRRYLLHKPTPDYDGILTTLIHVVGLPFGKQSHKMVILSAPRNLNNDPISDTLKLRIHFDDDETICVVHGDNYQKTTGMSENNNLYQCNKNLNFQQAYDNQSNHQPPSLTSFNYELTQNNQTSNKFEKHLASYVAHILETISPGLIELPNEMKLEILKKLSVDSIIKMSQVNNEFRTLIFVRGESLWRHLCYRDFNIKSINRYVHRSWMELYRDSYVLHEIEICRKERALPGLPERPALQYVNRLQIEWLPEVLAIQPLYNALNDVIEPRVNDQLNLALELVPLRRADSLDSLH